ncbi:MAG TPA: RES family NAD+ phosphorylase [Steroidobacteraceae bacterium]|nr:RES family NAD+ phosphorylase [Steroidobacteraceae bacterium]
MSSITWTPHAVASEARRRERRLWRAVEAQHVAATRRLVDTLEEQRQLEQILEGSKPPLPASARELHYLLGTPFRYPSPFGSRFRAPDDPGVFYGAAERRTACAEIGYWRWRFLEDSQGLDQLGPSPQSLFCAAVRGSTVDLTRAPFDRDAKLWQSPDDYQPTQAFARVARLAEVRTILYRSVRDPAPVPGLCGAVLAADAFKPREPVAPVETWFLTVTHSHATWQREGDAYEFAMERWRRSG